MKSAFVILLSRIVIRKAVFSNSLARVATHFFRFDQLLGLDNENLVCSTPELVAKDETPSVIIEKQGVFKFPPVFVCELPDVSLIGPHALAFSGRRLIVENSVARLDCVHTSIEANLRSPVTAVRTLLPDMVCSGKEVDLLCSLVNCWSRGYFHWVLECLTRLEGLECYINETGNRPRLMIDKNPPRWMIDSLELFGWTERDLVFWNSETLKAKRFVLPSFRRKDGRTSIKACYWLKKRISNKLMLDGIDIEQSKRILISRRAATKRRIANEEDVVDCLQPYGFETYCLEELTFSEQVRLFSQAEVVCAPHGAGLANMIFAPSGTKIFEIFGNTYINPCFYALAAGHNFKYTCLVSNQIGQDIVVDINQVKNRLRFFMDA